MARMRQVAEEARRTAKGIDSEILDYIIEWLGEPLSESAAVYVLSFSEAHNQLSQWRGYTSYGQGVCLSIDSALLVKRMQAHGWTFQNCRYGQVSQLAWADAILSRVRREAAANCVDKGKRRDFGTVFKTCLSDLLQVSATIKHDGFAEEREVRFISPMIDAQDRAVSHRPGNSIRIPYVNFHLADETDRFAIHEVMVGPGPEQRHIQSIIAKALREAEVKGPCLVSLCNIPYREI
jgi:Protein of unknown function (DUF2971)